MRRGEMATVIDGLAAKELVHGLSEDSRRAQWQLSVQTGYDSRSAMRGNRHGEVVLVGQQVVLRDEV